MNRLKLTERSAWSEHSLERYLTERVRALGGVSLKYTNMTNTGWPDRVCLLPGGRTVWVELKTTGRRPTRLQEQRLETLRAIGQSAHWADTREKIDQILLEASYEAIIHP